jgi:ferredoxin
MSDDLSAPADPSGEPQPRYERSDRAAQQRSRATRLGVLIAGLVIITTIGVLHQVGGIAKPVGVDALCPFGGIETLWSLVTGAGLLQRIAVSSVILLGVVVLMALVFRRSFCGYICPLGALQELFGKLGKTLWRGKKRPAVPAVIDRPARFLKYGVLAFFTVWTWQAAALVIRPYDPWVAWMHLTSGELVAEFGVGLAILGISVAGSVVYERFFCKYLCPMGAFLGVMAPVSLFKVRRNVETCIDCKACDKACPVNVTVSTVETVSDRECINCNECVNACPVAATLEVSDAGFGTKRTSLRPQQVLGMVTGLIAVLLVASTASGAFAWTMPTLTQSAEQNGGTINVEDIKGRMSFAEVSQATGIPAQEFEAQFSVQPADMTVPMKDIAAKYGFDVHTDVREWIAQRVASMPATTGTGAPAGTSGEAQGED